MLTGKPRLPFLKYFFPNQTVNVIRTYSNTYQRSLIGLTSVGHQSSQFWKVAMFEYSATNMAPLKNYYMIFKALNDLIGRNNRRIRKYKRNLSKCLLVKKNSGRSSDRHFGIVCSSENAN